MENYKDSIVAKEKGKIKNASISKNKLDRPSFWKGFLTGILSSLIASAIFYFLLKFIENYAA